MVVSKRMLLSPSFTFATTVLLCYAGCSTGGTPEDRGTQVTFSTTRYKCYTAQALRDYKPGWEIICATAPPPEAAPEVAAVVFKPSAQLIHTCGGMCCVCRWESVKQTRVCLVSIPSERRSPPLCKNRRFLFRKTGVPASKPVSPFSLIRRLAQPSIDYLAWARIRPGQSAPGHAGGSAGGCAPDRGVSEAIPPTGERDAGDPHVRFGGRGDRATGLP